MIADVSTEGKATIPLPDLPGPVASHDEFPEPLPIDEESEAASGVFRKAWREVVDRMMAEPPRYARGSQELLWGYE